MKTYSILLLTFFSLYTKAQNMNPNDQKLLEELLNTCIYRPQVQQQLLSVKTKRPDAWGSVNEIERIGWQSTDQKTIFFTDGESVSLAQCSNLKKLDLKEFAKKYTKSEDIGANMGDISVGIFPPDYLVLAAWFYALGDKKNATEQLSKTRDKMAEGKTDADLVTALKNNLAWSAFSGLIHCYMMRLDSEAEQHGLRFKKYYAKDFGEKYPQFDAIMAEIERKKKIGKFNSKAETQAPEAFAKMSVEQKISFLIESLDEIDQRQWGQPGGVSLGEDWRIQELIALGDIAVPKLIDVVESDNRFTRSVHFWRDFSMHRTLLSVKEAALTAIMSIWQDPVFRPASTGDNFTARGQEQAKILAQQLREQLQKQGNKTLDVRKMEVLLDPKSGAEERQAAASNLANFGQKLLIGTTVWSGRQLSASNTQNTLIEKYNNPTVAEAIWQAMEMNLKQFDEDKDYADKDYYRQRIPAHYLNCLVDLQDRRILPKINDGYKNAKEPYQLRQFAVAAFYLGDSSAWTDYCGRIDNASIALPPIEYLLGSSIEWGNPAKQPGNRELLSILSILQNVPSEIGYKTYLKLLEPSHPYYKWIELRLLQLCGGYEEGESGIYYRQEFALPILTRLLENKSNSEVQQKYYKGSGITNILDWGGQSSFRLHPFWDRSDYSPDKDFTIRARVCDMAASKLYHLIFGIPACHAQLKDKDERIERQKAFLKRFKNLRDMTNLEYNQVNELYYGTRYIPDIKRLDHPATAEEVEAGLAIFHLSGKGQLAPEIALPAVATLKTQKNLKKPLKIYLLQVEKNASGEIIYGALTEDGPMTLKAEELVDINVLKEN